MGAHDSRTATAEVTDPVCDMTFVITKAVATVAYRGTTYYFCTDACRRRFEQDPARCLFVR